VVAPVSSSTHAEKGFARFPVFLPDGRHFVYFVRSEGDQADAVYVGALDSPDRARVMSGTRMARYAAGHLLFVSGRTLMAQRFDPRSHELSGAPIAIIDDVASAITGYAAFSASERGILAVATSRGRAADTLTWFDRSGNAAGTIGDQAIYDNLQAIPDGRVMFQRSDQAGLVSTWLLDPARNIESRVTDGGNAVVSPDGKAIAFNPGPRSSSQGVRRITLGSPGPPEELLAGKIVWPNDWSPDGRLILFMHPEAATNFDISVLDLSNGNTISPFVQTPANEGQARFSPDQRWVAYVSDESGQSEIYVRHFPDGGHKTVVSHGGGRQARWDRRGRALFYLGPDGSIVEVQVQLRDDGISASAPRSLFRVRVLGSADVPLFGGSYIPAEDGNRFLVAVVGGETEPRLNVIVNWPSRLRSTNPEP
jgi:hypothetical protein